jgi:large subunit ribosomal protein L5
MEQYKSSVLPALQTEMKQQNRMAIPRLEKIVISMGLGKALSEKKRMDAAQRELAQIAGQRPIVCKAKKSVSNFKVRQGYDTGLKVTLRGHRMYEFMDRLINIVIPRIRDFRGLDPKGFDGRGNFNMGLTEQTVFPEVEADKVEFQQGMNVTMVTTARNDSDGRRLLTHMGMPFRRDEKES